MALFGLFSRKERKDVAAHAVAVAINRDFPQAEREKPGKTGAAMPDGSFPIKSEADLKNAIRAIGRAKDPAAVKRHIISRAKSLGLSKLIPEDWRGAAESATRGLDGRPEGSPEDKSRLGVAAHAVVLPLGEDGEPPEWIQVIPAGTFTGDDGRGPYYNSDPEGVVALTRKDLQSRMRSGLPVDLDHAGALAAPLGLPAPAVGWIREVEARSGAIFARVEWTAEGAQAIRDKKWKYLSPVFAYEAPEGTPEDASTGIVKQLRSVALTNNPNLTLPAVANRNAGQRDEDSQRTSRTRLLAPRETRSASGPPARSLSRTFQEQAMRFTPEEIRLIAIHAKKARPLHETVKALQEALPNVHPHKILDMAKLACEPEEALMDAADGNGPDGDGDGDDGYDAESASNPYDASAAARELVRPSGESETQMMAQQANEMAECATDEERSACTARHAQEKEEFAKRASAAAEAHARTNSRNKTPMTKAELDAVVAKHPMVIALNKAIGDLRGERSAEKAAVAVKAAIDAGKLIPAQQDWALAYCTADPAGFAKFIEKQPALALAADGNPTGLKPQGRDALGAANLNEDELKICTQTGTDPKKFLARRNEVYAAMAAKPTPGAIIRMVIG